MPERLAFLLGKDPRSAYGGDVTMARLLRAVADERFETSLVCLSDDPSYADDGVVRVAKPPVSLPALAARSVARGRSLVHTRFDLDPLVSAIEAVDADRIVAVHAYMAEPALRAAGVDPRRDLLVSAEVSEADVWRGRGPAGVLEARRIARDEQRVLRRARAVGSYDHRQAEALRAEGVDARWLRLTLPPVDPVDVGAAPPRIVLLGNRTWPPNAEAAIRLVALWPRISAGLPDAELLLVGPPGRDGTAHAPGVRDVGAVGDVTGALAGCRGLVAPIATGGGVRVKVLEAAARGLPVVTTPAGVGSIEAELGLVAAADDTEFVARCRLLLEDPAAAAAEGARLHAANAVRWHDRVGQDDVLGWLSA